MIIKKGTAEKILKVSEDLNTVQDTEAITILNKKREDKTNEGRREEAQH